MPKILQTNTYEDILLEFKDYQLIFHFHVIHKKSNIKEELYKIFAVCFFDIISNYEYFEYIKERTRNYILLNDVENIYNNLSDIIDVSEEQIVEYIRNDYIDDLIIYSNINTKEIGNEEKKHITDFTLNLTNFIEFSESIKDLENNLKNFFEDFFSNLNNEINYNCLVKYTDSYTKKQYIKYFSDIYDLEMELRKVLTYIFNYEYQNPYKLIKDYDIKLIKENQKDSEYFNKNCENEFFQLCFSDYIKIANKQLKNSFNTSDLMNYIQDSQDFNEFKNKFFLGIKNEKHLDFLSSIKTDLNTLEEMRNAIMHCRMYSFDVSNYEKSKEQLDEKIRNFWKQELE